MKRILVVFMIMMVGIPSTLAGVAVSRSALADGPDLSVAEYSPIDCDELQIFGVPMVPSGIGDVECGRLSVPENWLQPEGRIISISYVVLKSISPKPLPNPVIYLEGGPGGSALSGVQFYADFFAQHPESRDVVLFDQRGTQFSSKLDCSLMDVDSIVGDALSLEDLIADDEELDDAEVQRVDLRPSYDPEELMTIARQETSGETAACVRELLEQGVDLRQDNSVASARDTVALVQSIGYETYNLYGISYGTRLALLIMRDCPESGLRSVVLDSTFPLEINGFELYPSETHEVVTQVFADCSRDPICSGAYPNLKQRFIALLDIL